MDDSTSIGLYSISQSISRSRKNLDEFGDNLSSARRFLEIDRARLGFGIRLQLNKEGKFLKKLWCCVGGNEMILFY